jgi:hypothetical protein
MMFPDLKDKVKELTFRHTCRITNEEYIWVGIKKNSRGEWRWANNRPLETEIARWAPGEPSN